MLTGNIWIMTIKSNHVSSGNHTQGAPFFHVFLFIDGRKLHFLQDFFIIKTKVQSFHKVFYPRALRIERLEL